MHQPIQISHHYTYFNFLEIVIWSNLHKPQESQALFKIPLLTTRKIQLSVVTWDLAVRPEIQAVLTGGVWKLWLYSTGSITNTVRSKPPTFGEMCTDWQVNRTESCNQSRRDILLMSATGSPSCYGSWNLLLLNGLFNSEVSLHPIQTMWLMFNSSVMYPLIS